MLYLYYVLYYPIIYDQCALRPQFTFGIYIYLILTSYEKGNFLNREISFSVHKSVSWEYTHERTTTELLSLLSASATVAANQPNN